MFPAAGEKFVRAFFSTWLRACTQGTRVVFNLEITNVAPTSEIFAVAGHERLVDQFRFVHERFDCFKYPLLSKRRQVEFDFLNSDHPMAIIYNRRDQKQNLL